MSEQLAIGDPEILLKPKEKPLTPNQQLAYDLIRDRDGVTAQEIGQEIHARGRTRRHSLDTACQWCEKTGTQTATSKALKPLVTYRRTDGGRLYIARDKADRVRAPVTVREPTEAELQANPFAGLEQPGQASTGASE